MDEERIIRLEREIVETRNAAAMLILWMLRHLGAADRGLDLLDQAARDPQSPEAARIARLAAASLRGDTRP